MTADGCSNVLPDLELIIGWLVASLLLHQAEKWSLVTHQKTLSERVGWNFVLLVKKTSNPKSPLRWGYSQLLPLKSQLSHSFPLNFFLLCIPPPFPAPVLILKSSIFFKIFFNVDHFKILIEFVTVLFLPFILWPFGLEACRILSLRLGIEITPSLESEVPTTEPPRKSHKSVF